MPASPPLTGKRTPITALVLAGSRPGPDPLKDRYGVSTKALIPILDKPMLRYPIDALRAAPEIGTIIVLAQDHAELAADTRLADLAADPHVQFTESGAGISTSLADALRVHGGPLLVTTADHVLLTPAMIATFVQGTHGADVAAAMVERATLMARYPASRRTWIRLRSGAWSGANLFYFADTRALPVLHFWQSIEQNRKKGHRILAAFGPMLLAGAALRLLDIHQAVARAGRRFGVTARIVPMHQAEACIDADKPDDITLIEAILRQG